MTKKVYLLKILKYTLIDNLLLSITFLFVWKFFKWIVRYFSINGGIFLNSMWGTGFYTVCLLVFVWIPYVRNSIGLIEEGYEQTEKEKLKEIKRLEKWNNKYDKKQDKKQEKYMIKWRKDHFNIRTIDDLRKASLIQIIRWRRNNG